MSRRFEIVVVGTSTGGLAAISRLLQRMPANFPIPIAIVQHRSRESGETLCALIQRVSQLPVREVEDKDPIRPGVHIAPPDYHLLIDPDGFALSVDEVVTYSRPSIDVLFESAADTFGPAVIAVLLSGANQDGAHGAASVKAAGGHVIVQDPDTAEARTMPASAMVSASTHSILDVEEIAALLVSLASALPGAGMTTETAKATQDESTKQGGALA